MLDFKFFAIFGKIEKLIFILVLASQISDIVELFYC